MADIASSDIRKAQTVDIHKICVDGTTLELSEVVLEGSNAFRLAINQRSFTCLINVDQVSVICPLLHTK